MSTISSEITTFTKLLIQGFAQDFDSLLDVKETKTGGIVGVIRTTSGETFRVSCERVL